MSVLGRSAGATDTGRKRRRNEDAYVATPPLFAVADGMGGAQAGEIASSLAAGAVRESEAAAGGVQRVAALIQEANRRVHQRSSEDAAAMGMGTTMTVALVEGSHVSIGHVGDSRAYIVRDGELEQLTDDHSLVAELVRSGKLSPEEANVHPQRSVITRALGPDPDVDVDTFTVEARDGDVFLLCSDGLTTMVDDDVILQVVEKHRDDPKAAAQALVQAANRSGGEDNITVVYFEISADGGDTTPMPAVEPAAPEPDEEDTLSGLERTPALDTIIAPPPRIRQGPVGVETHPRIAALGGQDEGRSAVSGRLLYALLGLAVAVALAALVLWGLARAHFVGAGRDGHVAVYQGLPYDLSGEVRLYRAVYVSPVLTRQLGRRERQRLFDHRRRDRRSALAAVRTLERGITP